MRRPPQFFVGGARIASHTKSSEALAKEDCRQAVIGGGGFPQILTNECLALRAAQVSPPVSATSPPARSPELPAHPHPAA
jgi:hypothetical protein